ncbi:MAG: hypothetical protein EXS32_09100 [Opitutus sp.]|nr:hypothetical protein [Opitutus sp.]
MRPVTVPARHHAGFSFLKVSVIVFIISVALSLALPALKQFNLHARSAAVARDLRTFSSAFQSYAREHGDWPAGTGVPGAIPAGMTARLTATNWSRVTPIGGFYTWAPNRPQQGERYHAAIVIATLGGHRVSSDRNQLADLDHQLDNGDLATGTFRLGYRHYPVYVLEH